MTQHHPNRDNASDADLALMLFSFDLQMLEEERQTHYGIQIVIVHRFAQTEFCSPGEEIAAAYIVHKGTPRAIPLSTPHLILLDYLCRHRRLPQTATQIARGLSTEPFYVRHAANAKGSSPSRPRTSRTAVKEQIMRLRRALGECLRVASLSLDPKAVLRSERTSGSEVQYRIHAAVRWEH